MLNVVSLYGIHPIDLQSTAAVPRLNAQLLTFLAAGHTDWDFLAVSPAAKALPGVEAVAITSLSAPHFQTSTLGATHQPSNPPAEGTYDPELQQIRLGGSGSSAIGRVAT